MKKCVLAIVLLTPFVFLTGCPDSLITADFTAAPRSGTAPLTVQFRDRSTDGPSIITEHQWDFGDGAESTEQEPIHTYDDPGLYTVFLSVSADDGSSANISVADYIEVLPADTGTAAFTGTPRQGDAPLPVTFTDTTDIAGIAVASRAWTFGDGSPVNTDANPTHTYTNPGIYSVSLTVVDDAGTTYFLDRPIFIEVEEIRPDLTATPHDPLPAATADFDLEAALRLRWPGPEITYGFQSFSDDFDEGDQRDIIAAAFAEWAGNTGLRIVEAGFGEQPDINIGFGTAEHCELYNVYSLGNPRAHGCRAGLVANPDFDGPGGAIAHAYSYWEHDTSTYIPSVANEPRLDFDEPVSGDIHFDDDETYTGDDTSRTRVRLFEVALHQIGHVLGLPHSQDPSSVMYHMYDPASPKFGLTSETGFRLRSLYGGEFSNSLPELPSLLTPPTFDEALNNPLPVFTDDDHDGDGLDDATELFVLASVSVPSIDADDIRDPVEVMFGLDPHRPDTDYDGVDDDDEIAALANPAGNPFVPDQLLENGGSFAGAYTGTDTEARTLSFTIAADGTAEGTIDVMQYGAPVTLPLIGHAGSAIAPVDDVISALAVVRLVSYDQRILVIGEVTTVTGGFVVNDGEVRFLGGATTQFDAATSGVTFP